MALSESMAQAGAGTLLADGRAPAVELGEDLFLLFGGNARALVVHRHLQGNLVGNRVHQLDAQQHGAVVRVLHGIRCQVAHDLLEAPHITDQRVVHVGFDVAELSVEADERKLEFRRPGVDEGRFASLVS